MNLINKTSIALAIQASLFATTSIAAEQEEDNAVLEIIVVTAQKRDQNSQDVPISIATLQGEELDNIFAAGDDIVALATRIPGLYAESSNGRIAPRFYIRGLGNTDFDLAASQPVSIIMDEVVMENVVLKSFPLFDIEQVEVIRGPQGSLFGKNTTAGIIKFDSRKPTQETDGYGKFSYGTYGTRNLEFAVGAGLSDSVSMRVSVLNQHRDDWVDNSFTNENDVMGGYDETAARLQLLFTPSEELDVLLNVHARSFKGTSTLFRANILSTGSNELNGNFDRGTVAFNEGDNNPQNYDGDGFSLRVNYDLGEMIFSSITATESADGRSLGDIDGGTPAGPGFIPFQSVTEGAADIEQFTQEFRLASDTDNNYSWQTGFYYFDSDLSVTTSPFFIPSSTFNQTNTTWAVFGQGSYDISEKTTLIAGVRYTDDEKHLDAVSGVGIPISPIDLSDDQISWELMLNHKLESNMSVYTRVASGFRAQSIQGRDIAFFGQPSVAESETIVSFEVGFKADLLENTLRLNGAIFHYNIDDIQLTSVGGDGNSVSLRNAEEGVATGFELDAEMIFSENFVMTAGFSYNDTEINDPTLLIPVCGSGQCTPTDPIVISPGGRSDALVDGNPFPQAPETIFTVTAEYTVPMDDGEFYIFADYAHQGDTNFFIYESVEYIAEDQFELGLRLGYVNFASEYEVTLFGRNITDEENLKGGIDFNNNTGFVNQPRIWGFEVKKSF